MSFDKIRVCLIEDNEVDALVFRRLVRDVAWREYVVDWFENPEDALGRSDASYDIYVIDFTLHGTMSGLDVIAAYKDKGVSGPFILLTGKDDTRIAEQTRKLGVTYYLLKEEITPSLLDRVIMHSLSAHEDRVNLEAERAYSDSIIQTIPYAIICVDAQGHILRANSFYEKTLAFAAPLNKADDQIMPNFKGWGHYFLELMAQDGAPDIIKVTCPKHAARYWEWQMVANIYQQGALFVIEDITARLEKDKKKRQKDKMEALGYLAGGVAHELNNCLQPIMLIHEMIEDKARDIGDDKLLSQARIIGRHTEHGAEIVRDILDFARVDKEALSRIAFPEALHDAVGFLRSSLPSGVQVSITAPSNANGGSAHAVNSGKGSHDIKTGIGMKGSKAIEIDLTASDMIKIVRNIVMNASDAMARQGEIEIAWQVLVAPSPSPNISTSSTDSGGAGDSVLSTPSAPSIPSAPAEVAVAQETSARLLEIRFTDSGQGIDDKIADRIFDSFFSTKGAGMGSGLGLSIVYNIIKTAGGSIYVENMPGRGASFCVRLPIRPAKTE